MTPQQADRIIKAGVPVTVRDAYGDVFTRVFTARDHRMIEVSTGGRFERSDLTIIAPAEFCAKPRKTV